MSSKHTAQPLSSETGLDADSQSTEMAHEVDELADVIELPGADESWYQRNSGALPKSEAGMADSHRRNQLPTPRFEEKASIPDRIRSLLRQ
ncbi:MAG: hypothetical protein ACR2N2_04525 [Acidimicrobiia bacterium]